MTKPYSRITRYDELSPGNIDAVCEDADDNRFVMAIEREYEVVW